MRLKDVAGALAVAALAAGSAAGGPALAQQAGGSSGLLEANDDSMVVQPFGKTVDEIEDMDVVGPGGEEIGEVEEVLVDASNQPVALAVEAGGFLGIGEKDVVIELDQLQLENDRLATSLTKEQIETLPEWND